MKSSDLVNKLQFVERFWKTAAVTWCLLCDVSFGLNLTLPECKWCLLVPDNFLNPLHTTAVKKKKPQWLLLFDTHPIVQLTVCALF